MWTKLGMMALVGTLATAAMAGTASAHEGWRGDDDGGYAYSYSDGYYGPEYGAWRRHEAHEWRERMERRHEWRERARHWRGDRW